MSEIHFRCPNCTAPIAVPQEMIGQDIYCRYCYRKLTVPARSEPDRRADRGDIYKIDDGPQDARGRSMKFYLPEYRCPICGTAIPVAHDEIGVKKFCPDCETPFTVTQEWYEETRRKRREEQMRSWTDPAIRLHPERYPEKIPPRQVYGVNPIDASKPSELVHWPEPKKNSVSTVCPACRSILYINEEQIGSTVRCPDCAAPFKVTQRWFDSKRKQRKRQEKSTQAPHVPFPPSPSGPASPDAPDRTGVTPPSRVLLPFNCPHCGGVIYLGSSRIGKKIRCPDCGTSFSLTERKFEETRRRSEARRARLQYGGSAAMPVSAAPLPGALYSGSQNVPPAPKKDQPPQPPKKKLIPVLCGLCGTLLYAEESQIGQQIRCPDCETYTTVTSPLDSGVLPEPSLGEGYDLSETNAPAERPAVIEPTFTGAYDLAEPEPSLPAEEDGADGNDGQNIPPAV